MVKDNYILSGPPNFQPIPSTSLGKYLYTKLISHGDKIAQVDALTGESRTFSQILSKSLSIAKCLQDRGLGQGNVVAICSENCLDFVLCILASYFLGATCATLNPNYTVRELHHAMNISKPCIVFSSTKALKHIDEVSRHIEEVKEIVTFGKEQHKKFTPFASLLQENSTRIQLSDGNPDELVAAILCSSGTTGMPKGVMLTQKNILAVFIQMIDPRYGGVRQDDIVLGLLPFFHAYSFIFQLVSMATGMRIIVMSKFEEDLFLNSIQKYKVTLLFLAPPLVLFLAKSPIVDNYDLSSVRDLRCGSAPLSKDVLSEVSKRLKLQNVRQGYGLTETTLAVTVTPYNKIKYGSCGVLAPDTQCKVVDLETGKNLGPYKSGELCFKSPLIMKGYCGDLQATSGVIDKDGFLHTGDVGYYDTQGYFFIVDRVKELIKYKGYQVPPAELEAILLSHPAIKDAAVIGIPDDEAGELPKAFVVNKQGMKTTKEEIMKFVADQVSSQKRLRGGVEFVDTIPKSATGKILRRILKQMNKSKL